MTDAVRRGDLIAGKYRVERVLGPGGMGVVVAARHVDLGELRAVKRSTGPSSTARSPSSASAARRLPARGSAASTRVYDVGGFDEGAPNTRPVRSATAPRTARSRRS